MKKDRKERRSGKDRRSQPRFCFGPLCRDRRKIDSPEGDKVFEESKVAYWPQAV